MTSDFERSDEPPRSAAAIGAPSNDTPCVAVVDDDALVAKALAAALNGPDCEALVFATAAAFSEALPE